MKERVEQAPNMGQAAQVIEDAFSCGMAQAAVYATAALQAMAVDAASVIELAAVSRSLSVILQYGDIRQLDSEPLKPILQQVFFRACLILPGECVCDDEAAKAMAEAIEQLNSAALAHDFLDAEAWNGALREVAERDEAFRLCHGDPSGAGACGRGGFAPGSAAQAFTGRSGPAGGGVVRGACHEEPLCADCAAVPLGEPGRIPERA